jgi:hypothetical protein
MRPSKVEITVFFDWFGFKKTIIFPWFLQGNVITITRPHNGFFQDELIFNDMSSPPGSPT